MLDQAQASIDVSVSNLNAATENRIIGFRVEECVQLLGFLRSVDERRSIADVILDRLVASQLQNIVPVLGEPV